MSTATADPIPVRAFATIDQTATFLTVSKSSVRRLIAAGKLPSQKIGRSRRILWTDLEAFVKPR